MTDAGLLGEIGMWPAGLLINDRSAQEYKEHAAEEDRQLELAVKHLGKPSTKCTLSKNRTTDTLVTEAVRARDTTTTKAEASPNSLHFVPQAHVVDRTSRVEPKPKPKTRPEDSSPNLRDDIMAQLAVVELQEPRPTISVRSRSVEVFDRMFTAAVSESSNIDWEEFVAAMVDAGCAATPNGGSAVTFRQCNFAKSAIGFHRPHDSKVNPVMLKAMGRRLRKRFDWDAETFVMREKEGGKEDDANDA
ncbi:hypothetical protein LTS10_012210 [Elasticomyces elasticus]|nr:hypothetical protein LTS10_012210 [Elasticomyces elasticus]